jgi:hypothetical protein
MTVIKKTVAIHPIMDSLIRKTWAMLIESGKDVSYSASLNFIILIAILETSKNEGLSEETRKIAWKFVEDQKAIEELNLEDLLANLAEKVKPEKSN